MNRQFYEFEKKSIDGMKKRTNSGIPEWNRKIDEEQEEQADNDSGSGVFVVEEPNAYGEHSPPAPSRRFRSSIFWICAGGCFAALALAAAASLTFARLTVLVKPRVENVDVRDVHAVFDVSAGEVRYGERVIPAELLEFKKTVEKEFTATGEEYVSEKARGKALVYNRYSSSPQKLVATTRFMTEDGALFRLLEAVTVPGANVENGKIVPRAIEVELIADAYGEESNRNGSVTLFLPGLRESAKYEGFYASAPSGFQGGFRGRARVVSKSDRKQAEDSLLKQAHDELRREIARKTPSQFTVINDLIKIRVSELNLPQEKTRLERFQARAEIFAEVLVFRAGDVRAFLADMALSGDATRKIIDESFSINYSIREFDAAKKRADVALDGNMKTKRVIFENELAPLVRGRKEASIVEALKSREELADFRVAFFPPWIFSAPKDQKKIKFIIE